jgi:Phage major capsid protein E
MEDLTLTFPYTATDLTDQINVIPNRYGLMQELDLFPTEGSISTIVEMRYENKTLRVLPARERDASSTPMLSETGKTIFMEIPHFSAMDLITPKDLRGYPGGGRAHQAAHHARRGSREAAVEPAQHPRDPANGCAPARCRASSPMATAPRSTI